MERPTQPSITATRTSRTQKTSPPGRRVENVSTRTSPSPKKLAQPLRNNIAESVLDQAPLARGLFCLRIQKRRRPTSDPSWSSEVTCAVVGLLSIALNPKFHSVSKGAKCEKAAS